jgi:urease gamma subunit
MLNGDPKAMLIESIDGRVLLVGPHAERHEVLTVKEAMDKAKELKWEIHIEHLFGEGTRRRLAELLREKSKEV